MPNIGPVELIIILVILLLLFGGTKLPQLSRSIGQSMRELRGAVNGDAPTEDDEKPAKKKKTAA